MRKVVALLLLLGLPAAARATWALIPVEELVRESDLIVVGTLRDVEEHTADGTDYGRGRIAVREVIWGDAAPGDALLLRWDTPSAVVCPRVEHRYAANVEGIWLLTRDGGAVAADYPGRFVKLSERGKVEAALGASPVVLRSEKHRVEPGEPMPVAVVYRNTSRAPRTFPGLAFGGGAFRLGPGPRLAVTVTFDDGSAYGEARLPGRVVRDAALAPVTLPPRGEHRVEFDLRELLAKEPAEKDSYDVTLKFDGLPRTNELGFYVGKPLPPRPRPAEAEPPGVDYSRQFRAAPVERRGPTPLARAALAALAALLLFPFFHKLRSALAGARLARVTRGTRTWQI